ncbi:endopeptidase La [Tepidiforma sp.]|uniref:endopeptidase La n=1 Tax=Tepidiforma sp. TaxID=2682230 RepID=UPI002ADDD0E4|nr:endopeptidase La [Tepidiforma sp.]
MSDDALSPSGPPVSESSDAAPQEEGRVELLPVMPLRGGTVVFPFAVLPLAVGQPRSVRLVDDVMRRDRRLVFVAQKTDDIDLAGPEHVHRIGTIGVIHHLARSGEGTLQVVVQGIERVRILEFVGAEPYLQARVERAPERPAAGPEGEALRRAVLELIARLVAVIQLPQEFVAAAEALTDPLQLAYLVGAALPLSGEQRQELLELDAVEAKLRKLIDFIQHEIAVRELGRKIAEETEQRLSKSQREYFLREQLRSIQKELGEGEGEEIAELRRKLDEAGLPPEARAEADRELDRLALLPPGSPEQGMIRTYLDWMANLPWQKLSGSAIDIDRARTVLDEDHYDLEKIKDRILDYLAVRKLRAERAAAAADGGEVPSPAERTAAEPILCFVGPPGVGKTSLGQSIARALDRAFARVALGGVHDEAEIRGHRRTYIGAMPGRIVQALRQAGTRDPVIMLDEIDKVGSDWRGDPAAALLEVLDPAQNHRFTDTYLGVPFDLSAVLFIATANTLDTVSPPLRDRMEVMQLSGYTEEEKLQIAERYLVPRQLRAHGLRPGEIAFEPEALRHIIRRYTREAGVRGLEREIAGVVRRIARRVVEGEPTPVTVDIAGVERYLGRPRIPEEALLRIDRPGIATGLAWTPAGGDVLQIEAAAMPASEERLILTGQLGDVMRESVQAALTWVRSNAERLGFDPTFFEHKAVHVHVPAGAVPKDGPSAGITMATALASLATGRPVRADVAMTGEITLHGRVLPVGGIKEKVLAAHRFGIRTVILPKENERDTEDVPEEARKALQFHFVDDAFDVIRLALT